MVTNNINGINCYNENMLNKVIDSHLKSVTSYDRRVCNIL